MAGPLWAGEVKSSKEVISQPQESCLYDWFIAGSGGYLVGFDEPMETIQIGADLPRNFAGWCMATYLEVGYTQKDNDFIVPRQRLPFDVHEEIDIIPVTLNLKFERPLTGNLNAYWGLGLGAAFSDYSARVGAVKISKDDTAFAAQLFAGLVYNVNKNFEVFGGARWIYSDVTASAPPIPASGDLKFGSNAFFELGLRYNF